MSVERKAMAKFHSSWNQPVDPTFKRNYRNPLFSPKFMEATITESDHMYTRIIEGMYPAHATKEEVHAFIVNQHHEIKGEFLAFEKGRFKYRQTWCDYAF